MAYLLVDRVLLFMDQRGRPSKRYAKETVSPKQERVSQKTCSKAGKGIVIPLYEELFFKKK
jgi:hypothetical protein